MNKNRLFVFAVVAIAVAGFIIASILTKKNATDNSVTPALIDASILIKPHSYVIGPASAKVTIVEFLDPECEACRATHPVVKRLLQEYSNQVRFVVRYMPFHGNSFRAASALEEAREIGKYEEALELLFEHQPEWGDHHHPRPELISKYLEDIGMKPEQLDTTYLLSKHSKKVEIDQADGYKAGVLSTPSFFVNGRKLSGISYDELKGAIEEALR